jgi:tetratricopeptide (TPR) repeat protein
MLADRCDQALAALEGLSGAESARLRAVLWLRRGALTPASAAIADAVPPQVAAQWLSGWAVAKATAGDDAGAVAYFELAQRFGVLGASSQRAYGESLIALGRSDAGIAVLRALSARDADDADTLFTLGGAIWDGDPGAPEAVALVERAVQQRDYFPYRYRLGTFYWYLGRLDEAQWQFERVLDAGVARFDALNALGGVAVAQGRFARGAELYQRAYDLDPRPDVGANLAAACKLAIASGALDAAARQPNERAGGGTVRTGSACQATS